MATATANGMQIQLQVLYDERRLMNVIMQYTMKRAEIFR